jgi:hypothetical protein
MSLFHDMIMLLVNQVINVKANQPDATSLSLHQRIFRTHVSISNTKALHHFYNRLHLGIDCLLVVLPGIERFGIDARRCSRK